MNEIKKKYFKILSKIVVSGTLVFFLITHTDWVEVMQYVRMINVWFIVLFILFYVIGLLISAYKWHYTARHLSFSRSMGFYLRTYIFGTFLNNFLPSFVGGDTYRIFALGKKEHRLTDASATIVVDRISGLYATMVLACVCGLLNVASITKNTLVTWLFIGMICCTLFGGIIYVLMHTEYVRTIKKYVPMYVHALMHNLVAYRESGVALTISLFAIVFALIGVSCANLMLFLGMNIDLSFRDYMSVIFLTSIVSAVPITIGNIGTKEWAYVLLFGIFGVSSSASVAVVLVSRVLQMSVSLVALPSFLWEKEK